jgi:hypothetical protein
MTQRHSKKKKLENLAARALLYELPPKFLRAHLCLPPSSFSLQHLPSREALSY